MTLHLRVWCTSLLHTGLSLTGLSCLWYNGLRYDGLWHIGLLAVLDHTSSIPADVLPEESCFSTHMLSAFVLVILPPRPGGFVTLTVIFLARMHSAPFAVTGRASGRQQAKLGAVPGTTSFGEQCIMPRSTAWPVVKTDQTSRSTPCIPHDHRQAP